MAGWKTGVGGAKARHKGKSRGWLLVVTGIGAVQRSGGRVLPGQSGGT